MTQEDKQLLFITLCGMLPYGVMLNVPTIDGSENKKLVSIVNEDDGVPCVTVYSTEEKKSDGSLISYAKTIYAICDVLPYLRPMSSMTLVERIELKAITKGAIQTIGLEDIVVTTDKGFDYLNAHHIDYRGLIEKGLALEAPKDMYKDE